jgi:hypothetical protein
MDDIFPLSASKDNASIILHCICLISRKYNLTWKLQKSQWFPQTVKFVGLNISVKGNSPAASKCTHISTWKTPMNPRETMTLISLAILHSCWIPFFELTIKVGTVFTTNESYSHFDSPESFFVAIKYKLKPELYDTTILTKVSSQLPPLLTPPLVSPRKNRISSLKSRSLMMMMMKMNWT